MNDVKTPPNKNQILEKYENEAEKVEKLFKAIFHQFFDIGIFLMIKHKFGKTS